MLLCAVIAISSLNEHQQQAHHHGRCCLMTDKRSYWADFSREALIDECIQANRERRDANASMNKAKEKLFFWRCMAVACFVIAAILRLGVAP